MKVASENVLKLRKQAIPHDSEELEQLRIEVERLRTQNKALKRKPYTEALERNVNQVLSRLSPDGKRLLRYLVQNEPLEVGKRFINDISVEDQLEQLEIGMSAAIIRHREVRVGSGQLLRTEYEINQQYRPVLESLLYDRS